MDPDIMRLYVMVLKYNCKIKGMIRLPMYYQITLSLPDKSSYYQSQYTRIWGNDEIFIYHQGNP